MAFTRTFGRIMIAGAVLSVNRWEYSSEICSVHQSGRKGKMKLTHVLFVGLLLTGCSGPQPERKETAQTQPIAPTAVTGLTPDNWVLREGLEATFPIKSDGNYILTVTGELPGLPPLLPQLISIEGKDLKGSATISSAGPFSVDITVGPQLVGPLVIKLKPSKSIVPKAMKINDDPRELAFRLQSIRLKPSR